jgi:adenylate kinase
MGKKKKSNMLNLILFGPPGSGKGTQADKLVKQYNLLHISTGDMFRYEMSTNTELGLKAKEFIAKGELVPDFVTIGMLKNKVLSSKNVNGFIFDGFPRTVPQATALNELMEEMGQTIVALIELTVEEDEIVERLLNRGKTSGRADDTDQNIIRNRIQVYRKETTPVADFYHTLDKSYKIKGIGTIDSIFDNLCDLIDKLNVTTA